MEQCVVARKGGIVRAGQLYEAYKAWVEYNAAGFVMSSRAFGDILREKGYKAEKRGSSVIRHGLVLTKAGEEYAAGLYTNKRTDMLCDPKPSTDHLQLVN